MIAEARERIEAIYEDRDGDLNESDRLVRLVDALEAAKANIADWKTLHEIEQETAAELNEAIYRHGERIKALQAQVAALEAVIAKARERLNAPIVPYADKRFAKVPEVEFLREAYGEELPDDLMQILTVAPHAALDVVIAAAKAEERSEWADWFDSVTSHVGPLIAVEDIAAILRADERPFGAVGLREGGE